MAKETLKNYFFGNKTPFYWQELVPPRSWESHFPKTNLPITFPYKSLNCHFFGPILAQQDKKLQNQGWLEPFEFKEHISGHKNAKRHYQGTKMAYLGLPRIKNCMQ